MLRTTEEWIEEYQRKDALWIHDGNPNRPHALLTSGKHSNGFFNSRLVIPDEKLLVEAAYNLLSLLVPEGGNISQIKGVVGPQTGATKLAELIHYAVIRINEKSCFWASPSKGEVEGKKVMILSDEDLSFFPQQNIQLCEDVLTTGVSVDLTEAAVNSAGGIVLPFVLVLVNRSGLKEVSGKKIVALIDHPMPMWTPEECPLCKQGGEAIRPKDPQNWTRLNANY